MASTMARTIFAAMLATAAGAADAATLNFLDLGNRLVRVDSAAPGTIASTVQLTGLRPNETIAGFDYRPASPRVLYGLGSGGQLYAINPLTGGAAAVGAPFLLNGTAAGVDFNPSVDRLRIVTNANQNLRINPDTGAVAGTDTPLAYAPGDAGFGTAPRVVAAAYSNNVAGGTPTTLYVIDVNRGVLATQGTVGGGVSPNTGQLNTVGALGVESNDNAGFDIARDGTVYASLTQPGTGVTRLYTVNLATGAATLVGTVGPGTRGFLGLAVAPVAITTFGTTVNQTNIGTSLDNFVGVPSAGLNAFFNSFDGLTGGQADALSQLTPAAYTLLPELTLRTAEFEQASIQRYLRDFRDGATGRAKLTEGGIGMWLIGSGRDGRYKTAIDRPRVNYGSAGVIGGIDFQLRDQLLVGVFAGYDAARVNLGVNVAKSAINGYFGGGYATFSAGPAFVDVFGSYGKADYTLRRGVAFGGTTALDFIALTQSRTYLGGGTVGLRLKAAGFAFEPFAGARYARLKIDGFNEFAGLQGTGFGALGLGRVDYESILGNFGAKLGADIAIGNVRVRPEIRGAYRHEFRKDRNDGFGYTFAGTGSATPIGFTPTPLRRNYYTGGAGFTISGANSPLALVIDYDGEFAKDRDIHGITGGLRFSF